MEKLSRGGRRSCGSVSKVALLFCSFICLFSLCAILTSGSCGSLPLDITSIGRESHVQGVSPAPTPAGWRRELTGGPGSYPPRCMAKCGDCTPCNPVHVAVPPGTPVTTEYYPEAWRCKCGNKLYMP